MTKRTRPASIPTDQNDLEQLLENVRNLVVASRKTVARGVDLVQVHTCFQIGRQIVEFEQSGDQRAPYGKEVIRTLADRLTGEFGRGFFKTNLEYMRRFFFLYQKRIPIAQFGTGKSSGAQAPSSSPHEEISIAQFRTGQSGSRPFSLGWTHYVFLMGINDPDERKFYEIEADAQGWNLDELKRQYNASLYERLALSRDPEGIRQLANQGQVISKPRDLLKEPLVLEFLGLEEQARYSETELEGAIINRIEHFLLELGKGFLFEARQKRFSFDDEHFFVDLVFYNRLLRCYVTGTGQPESSSPYNGWKRTTMPSQSLIPATDPRFVVLVHGGAWAIPESLREAHAAGTARAHAAALDALARGLPPLQAVTAALKVMEDDPTFDAGTGSFLNEDGQAELDAAVMEGRDLRAGAVASVGRFRNPCEIALAVMERTEHVLLMGAGAERFAEAEGFQPVDPRTLVHPREFAGHMAWVAAGKPDARTFFAEEGQWSEDRGDPSKRGTVGVVLGVRRPEGGYGLFAGISTGGTRGKKAGRVGDAPLVGCGLYADDQGGAVCCTGWGEAFIRTVAAKSVSDLIGRGVHPQEAVETVLREIFRRTQGRGGIIAVGPDGRTGAAFTTPDMGFAGPSCRALALP